MRISTSLAVAFQALCFAASAAVVPVSPTGGATVALLPEAQKKIMSFATHEERVADIKADAEKPKEERYYGKDRESKWRTSLPLKLEWRTTDGEAGPWKILLGKTPDLSDATEIWLNSEAALKMTLTEKSKTGEKVEGNVHVYTYEMPCANLEIGRAYYWKVWSNVACRRFPHGSTMYAKCLYCDGRRAVASDVASFVTEDLPPRWIKLKSSIANVRDLGGWKTLDGRRLKQGIVFRGQGLNNGSVNGERPGKSRMMVEDVKYLRDELGIKTILDLRTDLEAGGMTESPLGPSVKLVHRASPAYEGLFAVGAKAGGFNKHLCADGKKAMAENFRLFCDKANYPIYFHCAGGADRTGSLAYVLMGVLGVPKHDVEVEWEATFYPNLSELACTKDEWRSKQHFDEGFAAYGDADTPLKKRIELYLLDCGVKQEEIERFRSIMLDPSFAHASTAGFDAAQPIWPEGETDTLNSFFTFRGEFDATQGDDVRLRATAGYVYKARLNGEFAAFGPARATPGFFRVDEWKLSPKTGRNAIEIDVAGYNCPNFYLAKQTPFLQAEILVNGKVVAATGGKGLDAFTTGKLRKTPRYAYQRPYSEVYRLPFATGDAVQLAAQNAKKLLPREWDYPKFEVVEMKPISRETTRRDDDMKPEVPRFLQGGLGDFVCFPVAELDDNPFFDMQRRKTVSRTAVGASQDGRFALEDGEGVVFALDRVRGGFPGLAVRVETPTTIYLTYDEILKEDGSVDFLRTDTMATLAWHLDAPGDYALESFEPYGCKYMRVLSVGGRAAVSAPYMRTYESPSAMRAKFRSSDPALEKIFEAARASYVANAVDCLTDCPNRERGGWLGDAFFTGRASQWLTGTGKNEKLFLENFSRAERFPSPKRYEGLVPALWPCDLMCRECFIPTFDMWLIGELGECVARNGYSDLADAFRPKVDGILEYLGRHINDYGLLQNLPGWVFIEWSDANTLVHDVNYPANMLYAWSLDAAAKLYGRGELADEAEKIRERVRKESFNGKWFCDNAVVKDRVGFLVPSGRCTEVCQYFAFFTGTATAESHPELHRTLLEDFGPNRAKKGLHPEVAPANFLFGTLLRMEILSREGRSRQMYDELRDYFLYMSERTGTLWENQQPSASCCHGFASITAEYLFRDMLGVRRVDYVGKRVFVAPPADIPLDWCEGVVPLSDDAVAEISWHRGQDGKISCVSSLPEGWNVVK